MKISVKKQIQLQKSLYDYLKIQAQENGNREYLIEENRTISYGEALNAVQNLGTRMVDWGIKKGDFVVLRITGCAESCIIVMALASIGATAILCDAHFGVKEYIEGLRGEISPQWYISNEYIEKSTLASGNWVLESSNGKKHDFFFEYDKNIATAAYYQATRQVCVDELFIILFTSGSTGNRKAVMLSHKNCIAVAVDVTPLYKHDKTDKAILLLPLCHAFGFSVLTSATFSGHSIVFPESKKIDHVLSCIEKYKITVIYSVPTLFLELLSDVNYKKYDLSSLRLGVIGGGPVTERQMHFIENGLDFKLVPIYGMSECFISSMGFEDSAEDCAVGVGRPYSMTEVTILAADGKEVKQGETGEICVNGQTRMLGYYNDQTLNDVSLDKEGRLHTGDLGYFDKKGILHISGRKKDIIIRGGENIAPVKVEAALLKIEGIYQVVVVAKKDEKYGEVPVAAVVLENGYTLSEQEIRDKLLGLLSKHEIPVNILFLDKIPLNQTDKPDKKKVKEMFKNKNERIPGMP